MILVIDALNKDRFGTVLDDVFKLRARVFGERMGWDVNIQNGREIDEFDELDPAYVVSLDDSYNVIGCARLLQTVGPHMLSDVFYDILDGEPPLRSVTMWESTRFCVDHNRLGRGKDKNSVSYTTSELMVGILEYARESGISDIITVIDPIMDRVLKRSDNTPYGYVGKTADMGKVKALAALIDSTEERISRVRAFAEIQGDVFVSEDEVEANIQPPIHLDMSDSLREYCFEQLESANSERERAAARALQQAIAGMAQSRRGINA